MSRLIVKNLPKVVSEQKIRDTFSSKGTITDVQLKYKDGKFRQFCFVGFQDEKSAENAVKFFDNTFFGTSKIKVEVCAVLGDDKKSKLRQDNKIETQTEIPPKAEAARESKKSKKSAKVEAILGDHKDDPQFQEFLQSHAKGKLSWANDLGVEASADAVKPEAKDILESETEEDKLANKAISDLDYMKNLMADKKPTEIKVTGEAKVDFQKKEKKAIEDLTRLFTIKMRNVPKKVKREDVIKFFRPSKAHSVRIPRSGGFAYVGFKLERDMQRALTKDKSFFLGKQIQVCEFTEQNYQPQSDSKTGQKINPRWQQQEEQLIGEEGIVESGKLFFRNLAYSVKEDDLQTLFEKYGTVVEINVPIDSVSRKIKGFGTVTFMMPENALTAYNELNRTIFHGRMFHLLPGKANDTYSDDDDADGSNYKKKKQNDLKKSAGSAHNWNTLFLGANAVADVMAKTYGKSKQEVLDFESGGTNAAVRLALGETQIVLEMKKFLEENGVRLEAFDDISPKRSKTIILAKNLPAGTGVDELQEKFSQFGLIDKIILPPSGVTCLIQFNDPSEARKAFKKLAYSKFKHLPLYLEWAPDNVIKEKTSDAIEKVENENDDQEDESNASKQEPEAEKLIDDQDDEDDTPPEANSTIFIKNLSFETVESTITNAFKHLGPIHTIQIARKHNPENPKQQIHLGYGFIQFKMASSAEKALKTMQFSEIDDKRIELKRSDRTIKTQVQVERKKASGMNDKAKSSKIMVKNIPFQAKVSEIRDLFKTFGELKAVRLPLKQGVSTEQHRGFGFVDFVSKSDAKNAYDALHLSTHLYGRRLVLEWAEAGTDVEEIRKRTAQQMGANDGASSSKKSKKGLLKDEDFIKFTSDDEENL